LIAIISRLNSLKFFFSFWFSSLFSSQLSIQLLFLFGLLSSLVQSSKLVIFFLVSRESSNSDGYYSNLVQATSLANFGFLYYNLVLYFINTLIIPTRQLSHSYLVSLSSSLSYLLLIIFIFLIYFCLFYFILIILFYFSLIYLSVFYFILF
jgi:hypothetical protein